MIKQLHPQASGNCCKLVCLKKNVAKILASQCSSPERSKITWQALIPSESESWNENTDWDCGSTCHGDLSGFNIKISDSDRFDCSSSMVHFLHHTESAAGYTVREKKRSNESLWTEAASKCRGLCLILTIHIGVGLQTMVSSTVVLHCEISKKRFKTRKFQNLKVDMHIPVSWCQESTHQELQRLFLCVYGCALLNFHVLITRFLLLYLKTLPSIGRELLVVNTVCL